MNKLFAGLGTTKIRRQQGRGKGGFATNRRIGCAVLALVCLVLVNCTTAIPNAANSVGNVPPVQSIAATSGTPQSHAVDGAFGTPLAATVTASGSAVSGAVVTFTAPSVGASGTFADTGKNVTTAATNASGVATPATFTASGTAGSYTVTASVSRVLTPATFNLTNTTGAPASILASGGNAQQTSVTNAFTQPFAVTVVDVGQNPVGNAIVTFSAPSAGASGTFADTGTNTTTATTNASGMATSAMFTSNSIAGADTVTASVGGASPANFNLTNAAGAPVAITATAGTPQSTATTTAFSVPLVVSLTDSYSNPVVGVAVTFTGPSTSGSAGGTFANGKTTETDRTDATGTATSTTFSANAVNGGPYNVSATVAGLATPALFSLSNTAASTTYVFYLRGQEFNFGPNFYAIAGAVKIDGQGNVLTGEQDYNDGFSIASLQPAGDSITGGTLTVDPTGLGTLTLNTNDPNVGVAGVEILGVQFVNTNHAQITEFDGIATSSGSMDLQTLPSSLNGSYAFTLTGVDPFYSPVGFGGVFTISGDTTLQSGLFDINDSGTGTVMLGTPLSGTISKPDSLGRGFITGFTNPLMFSTISLNYYAVGPEVIRLIDVDTQTTSGVFTTDAAVGSAFGQGTNAGGATNASLGNSVFGLEGSTFVFNYEVAGQLSPTSGSGTFLGVAEDNEVSTFAILLQDNPISGNYSIASNGYGNLTIAPGVLGDISALGVYLTDPNLNLNDPNNTTTGLGGAVVADMDPVSTSTGAVPAGGIGILIPTDTSASFAGTYAFGARGINAGSEFDFVGVGPVTSGTLNGTGILSDLFGSFGFNLTNSGVTFSGTPQVDPSNPARYTMLSTNAVPNPLTVSIGGTALPLPFDVVMYQGTGGQLFWIDEDFGYGFIGLLEQQGSLVGLPAARVGAIKRSDIRRKGLPGQRPLGRPSPWRSK